jgi:serine/threonine protein kinase
MSDAAVPAPQLSRMNYRVVKPLGTGAGSTILQIADEGNGAKKYALKVVKRMSADDDIYIDQARHEFEVVQRLNHPAIIKIYDCQVRRALFKVSGVELLMEYLDGSNLDEYKERIQSEEDRTPAENKSRLFRRLVVVFGNVSAALVHMHRRGVYHGDLKPSNIMTTHARTVRVIDFGTAWIKGEDKGRVQGTPQYMAPEQASEKVVNPATDIYNLGATMYRLFTDEYLNLTTPTTLTPAYQNRKPPHELDHDIPRRLSDLIMQCGSHDPAKRPPDVAEVHHRLVELAGRGGGVRGERS